ncbi:NAD(P)-binding protein [Hypoxylon trugodes]|uniref:NAD(P)-binding protein n=1 Tax=Hypoxylon trugodes TaxID=326681 RepID=UPI002191E5EF|nr:NAD(P)-binding protein [Hypoxylon trugodes]KAI1389172.1 NAD(P)-binding protein [Hypoxylon trugodes]
MAKGSILVTGANGGLGSAVVERIVRDPSLAQDYHGLYTVRKVETADDAKAALRGASKAKHQYDLVPLDLSSLDSTRKAAADINEKIASGKVPPIRALVLAAAYQEHTTHNFTNDGFDMTFQASYLSHFLLTLLLLQSMDKEKGRIVVIGSWTHEVPDQSVTSTTDARNNIGPYGDMYVPKEFHQIFTDPEGNTEPIAKGKWGAREGRTDNPWSGMRRYGASKLCEVMMMRELARRFPSDPTLSHVSALGVDPAAMISGLTRRSNWLLRVLMLKLIGNLLAPLLTWLSPNGDLRTTWKSAGDVIRASFAVDADAHGTLGERPNGLYLNGTAVADIGPEAKDEAKCRRLWRDSLEYAGVKEGDTILADWK